MSRLVSFRRFLLALLLAIGLLGAQFSLVEHGIEHAFHEHDEACIECLVLPGMLAVPKQIATLPFLHQMAVTGDDAVPPAPTLALWLAFRGRAPPLLQY